MGRQCAGGRCDVDRCHLATRALASGEEQLVPTSSRLILRVCRLKVAVPAARTWPVVAARAGQRLAVGRVWGAGGRCDVDRCHLATRARASGEERLVPTPSRILFHLSRLMIAVPAANPTRCGCPAGRRLPVGRVWAPEGAATSTAASPLRGRARVARSGLCRPPPGYYFTFPG